MFLAVYSEYFESPLLVSFIVLPGISESLCQPPDGLVGEDLYHQDERDEAMLQGKTTKERWRMALWADESRIQVY